MKILIFILILFILYYNIDKFILRKQWIVLLIGNIIFYSWTGYENFIYIIITGISTYLGALFCTKISQNCKLEIKEKKLDREEKKILKNKVLYKKRIILYSILLLNFGILGYLKYFNEVLFYFKNSNFKTSNLIIPLGISFYTFQSIGYLIDVYNEKYIAEKNFFKYFHFISFFPQLIQGPINRFDKLKKDLYEPHELIIENIEQGLFRILFGMLKKYAIANLLVDMVSNILDNISENTSGSFIVVGILMYSIQQYADFSGGIDMVLGIAQLFGIKMAENFRQPYFAISLGDFWRRWHISLGAWMRDYVFYPLALTKTLQNFGKWTTKYGGKYLGRTFPACIANILVFFLVGLWHGAQIHYIFWGLYNGIIIAVSDLVSPNFEKIFKSLKINIASKKLYIFQIIKTFILINIGWYFDRIEKVSDIILALKNTIFKFNLKYLYYDINKMRLELVIGKYIFLIIGISSFIVFVNSFYNEKNENFYGIIKKSYVKYSLFLLSEIFLILLSFTYNTQNGGFIYANF